MKLRSEKLEGRGEAGEQQLLPGIPNEITLDLVAPKLPWIAFHMLSSVSRGWQQAIRSRQVYDARVRSRSTQPLVLLNKHGNDLMECALYSFRDGISYDLPQFPGLDKGLIPRQCQCISLDRKLYVMGGFSNVQLKNPGETRTKFYMLDLVGQRNWKECASMQNPRSDSGVGVINGKIYIFGGICWGKDSSGNEVYGSEVYDPEIDAWSPIAPMKYFGLFAKVITMGQELIVHHEDEWTGENSVYRPRTAEVYHPLMNEWRIANQFLPNDTEVLVMVGGELHKLTSIGIDVYDTCANLWKQRQSFSFGVFGPSKSIVIEFFAAVVVDDELLAIVYWRKNRRRYRKKFHGPYLMRSQGLGCHNSQIVWQKMEYSLSLVDIDSPLLFAIQL